MCLPINPTKLFFAGATEQAEAEFRRLNAGGVMRVVNEMVAGRARTYVWGKDDTQLRLVENRLGKKVGLEPYGIDRA
jgi:hypothetical protein